MKTAALMVCKGFLDRYPPETQAGLIQLLPQKEQLDLGELPPLMPLKGENIEWDLIDRIHYSWIAPYLRTLTENEIRIFLAALSEPQVRGLEKVLGLRDHLPHLTSTVKTYVRRLLFEMVTQNQELIPYAFLPDHPLNVLLEIPSSTLEKSVNFLGLHDLSFEMKQIISTAELKRIFAALPKREGEYLNTLMLHREPLVFKRLFLEKWDGSKEQLMKILEERGLYRLKLALHGADPSLVWYLTRRLEMHQGTTMLKYEERPTHARAEQILIDQIQKILSFLQGEST